MTSSKSEKYLDEELGRPQARRETQRAQKQRRKRNPRSRSFALRKKRELETEASQTHKLEEAKKKIAKHLAKFPELDTDKGKEQAEKYLAWVVESLAQKFPHLTDEDIEYKTAVSSVKAGGQKRQKSRTSVRATHLPTLISVRNEESRNMVRNKRLAFENLYTRLTTHFSHWRTLLKDYSLQETEERGIDIFKELSN